MSEPAEKKPRTVGPLELEAVAQRGLTRKGLDQQGHLRLEIFAVESACTGGPTSGADQSPEKLYRRLPGGEGVPGVYKEADKARLGNDLALEAACYAQGTE